MVTEINKPAAASTFPLTLGHVWEDRCRKTPNATFLIEDDISFSYKQVDQLSEQAKLLLQQYRINSADVVGIQLTTSVIYVALIIACFKCEVTVLPLNPHLDREEAAYIIKKIEPAVIFTDEKNNTLMNLAASHQLSYQAKPLTFAEHTLFALRQLDNTVTSLADVRAAQPDDIGDRSAVILCTSGTTSFSKGSILSHKNVLYSELQFNRVYDINAADILILPSGFYHAIGFHHGIISTILAGSTLVLMPHYSSAEFRKLITRYHCTYLVTVPTVIYDVLDWYTKKSSLTRIISGGALLSSDLLLRAKKVGLPIYNIYGLTESVPFLCTSPAYFKMHHGCTTAGYSIAGMEVKLISSKAAVASPNTMGEIIVRGPTVFKGYYHDEQETKKVLTQNGWFRTGDLGHFTTDQALVVDGRIKDTIIRGGENISAYIVERYLLSHPGIKEAAVIGINDQRLGERIGAYIVMKPGQQPLSLTEVKTFFEHQRIAKKFWPEKLTVLSDLPKTSSGKIKKYLLN